MTTEFAVDAPVEGPVSESEYFAERVRVPGLPACSRLGVGTAHLGRMLDTEQEPEAIRTLHEAWRAGFLLTDSSPVYGQLPGDTALMHRSEQVLGRALAQWDDPSPIVCTKLDVTTRQPGESWRDAVAAQHARSRETIGRDHIHGLALHDAEHAGDEAETFADECMSYLHEQLDAGAISGLGLGGSGPTIQQRCLERGRVGYVLTFMRLSALSLQATTDIIPAARQHGAAVVLGSPLLIGLLGDQFEQRTAKASRHVPAFLIDRAQRFRALAERVHMPMPRLALRFALSLPMVDVVLTGLSTPAFLDDTRSAFEQGPLPADLYAEIWQLAQHGQPETRIGG